METAVVVRVPEAEHAIEAHRRAHTPSGADGMLTVLVPFADSALLVAGMVRECMNASERRRKKKKRARRIELPS